MITFESSTGGYTLLSSIYCVVSTPRWSSSQYCVGSHVSDKCEECSQCM